MIYVFEVTKNCESLHSRVNTLKAWTSFLVVLSVGTIMLGTFCRELNQFLQFIDRLQGVILFVCVVNGLVGVLATIGNIVIIAAIKKSPCLHRPSYLLIATLAMSDLGVGAVVQPLHILFKVAEMKNLGIYCEVGAAYKVTAIILSGLSFCTITAISFDRMLAVSLGVRYRTVVTVNRVYVMLAVFSLLSLIFGVIHVAEMKAYYAAAGLICIVSLVSTTFNYLRISFMLRKQHIRIQVQSKPASFRQENNCFNLGQYQKSVSSMLYVCLVFLLCYIPYLCVMITKLLTGPGPVIQGATYITDTIAFVNSAINPILYYWRMTEIRRAVRKLWEQDHSSRTSGSTTRIDRIGIHSNSEQ